MLGETVLKINLSKLCHNENEIALSTFVILEFQFFRFQNGHVSSQYHRIFSLLRR